MSKLKIIFLTIGVGLSSNAFSQISKGTFHLEYGKSRFYQKAEIYDPMDFHESRDIFESIRFVGFGYERAKSFFKLNYEYYWMRSNDPVPPIENLPGFSSGTSKGRLRLNYSRFIFTHKSINLGLGTGINLGTYYNKEHGNLAGYGNLSVDIDLDGVYDDYVMDYELYYTRRWNYTYNLNAIATVNILKAFMLQLEYQYSFGLGEHARMNYTYQVKPYPPVEGGYMSYDKSGHSYRVSLSYRLGSLKNRIRTNK